MLAPLFESANGPASLWIIGAYQLAAANSSAEVGPDLTLRGEQMGRSGPCSSLRKSGATLSQAAIYDC
jgi:hypothetical protein